MSQSIKEELAQTLDRLPAEQLLAVLRFARSLDQQAAEQAVTSKEFGNEEGENAIADFIAAAGCGQSGDPNSSLRVDEILYGRQGTP
jgi:hypothetical protein